MLSFNGTALFQFSFTMCLTKRFPHEFKSNARETWHAIPVSLADICLTGSLCNKGYMPRIIEGKEMNLIGDRLRVLRKKHHLSQQQLSERLETQAVYICRGSISRIEDKSRTVTDIELMGLAKVLGVKIQDLFE